LHSVALALGCALSYLLTTRVLNLVHEISPHDDLLGGMWAAISTAFVYRLSYDQSFKAALSRASATLLSFALCLVFLSVLPFSVWGMALLIGLGAFILLMVDRSDDVVTATITTIVVMVLAAIAPRDAWEQPILRLADTAVGIGVGLSVSWVGLRLTRAERARSRRSPST
jgi:uncharacterized membrane protein YgaE (UPF0421/DUF939 family)